MTLLKFFSPVRAYRDLRFFLATRRRHEIVFMALALSVTLLILLGFVKDSQIPKPYERNIIYVESWPLDRSDEEIKAQQKIDMAERARREAEFQKRQQERQAQFKKVDDQLRKWGI